MITTHAEAARLIAKGYTITMSTVMLRGGRKASVYHLRPPIAGIAKKVDPTLGAVLMAS